VIFIFAGVGLLHSFEWLLWVFGAFLVYTGLKLARSHGTKMKPHKNLIVVIAGRFFRISHDEHGQRFFVRKQGLLYITPLFLVLLFVESTDVLFAVDSVPAVIGITRDPFIVCTSNIFAVLGLRALYFLLAGVIERFRYLHYGLSAVLIFVGAKMIAEYFVPHGGAHLIPAWVSLLVIVSLLAVSMVASVLVSKRLDAAEGERPADEPSPDQPSRDPAPRDQASQARAPRHRRGKKTGATKKTPAKKTGAKENTAAGGPSQEHQENVERTRAELAKKRKAKQRKAKKKKTKKGRGG